MSVREHIFNNNSDDPPMYPTCPAMCLSDSNTLFCFLVCSGGTDLKDGSGTNSVRQREFHTLP